MKVECYTLDLYCDNVGRKRELAGWADGDVHEFNEFPHKYTGPRKAYCYRAARKNGWLISEKRQLCPKCSGKRTR